MTTSSILNNDIGKKGRVQAQRKKEDKAAAKVQAIARGNAARNTEIKKQAAASQMQVCTRLVC